MSPAQGPDLLGAEPAQQAQHDVGVHQRGRPADGEGAGDGCAGIVPPPGGPGGGSRAPVGCRARYRIPPGTRSRASTGTRCAHQRRMRDGGRPGQRGIWLASPGRRLMPAAQPAKSAGTPPGDDDLDAAAAHPGQGGGRQPALPAGQQPARGALATRARRATPHAGPVSGKDCRRPGSTTGTDPGRGWATPSPVPRTACGKPADRAGKTGHSLGRHRRRSRRPGAHSRR